MLTRKIFESRLSEMPFPGLWGEILQNLLMVRKRHCDISEALLYRLSLGAPIWPIGVGGPGFSRSEPIVVTPLLYICPVYIIMEYGSTGHSILVVKSTCCL